MQQQLNINDDRFALQLFPKKEKPNQIINRLQYPCNKQDNWDNRHYPKRQDTLPHSLPLLQIHKTTVTVLDASNSITQPDAPSVRYFKAASIFYMQLAGAVEAEWGMGLCSWELWVFGKDGQLQLIDHQLYLGQLVSVLPISRFV